MVGCRRRTLLAAGALLATGCAAPDPGGDDARRGTTRPVRNWTTAGYDAGNRGYVPGADPVREHAEEWRSEVDSRADILASPVVVDGAVYAGSGRTVHSLSLEDGSGRWSTETEYDTGFLSGTVVDGTLLVSGLAGDGGALLALDTGTGAVEWRYPVAVSTAPTVVDGRAYVGTADPERALVAVDVAGGDEVWEVSFDGGGTVSALRSAPAVHEGTVYTTTRPRGTDADSSTVLRAVGTDGTRLWERSVPGETNSAPAVAGSTAYFATNDGVVHAVDSATGEERWSTAVSGPVYSSPAVDEDHVYLGTFDGTLYAIDRERGTKTWDAGASVLYSDPAVTGETVYVGGETVQAREKRDGTVRWSYDMFSGGHTEFTSPAVVDGTVLAGACTKERRHQATYDNFVLRLGGGGDDSPG